MATPKRTSNTRHPGWPKLPASARGKAVTLDHVCVIALSLAETKEGTSYGTPGFKVKGKLFARMLDDDESIVLRMDREERSARVAAAPGVFAVPPHYEAYPWVVVRLATVGRTLLRELLESAWRMMAPAKLAASFRKDSAR